MTSKDCPPYQHPIKMQPGLDTMIHNPDTVNLLNFLDVAACSIKMALERPPRSRRKVNHRKYLHTQLKRRETLSASKSGAEKGYNSKRCRRESSRLGLQNKSLNALFDLHKLEKNRNDYLVNSEDISSKITNGTKHFATGNGKAGSASFKQRKLPLSFFVEPGVEYVRPKGQSAPRQLQRSESSSELGAVNDLSNSDKYSSARSVSHNSTCSTGSDSVYPHDAHRLHFNQNNNQYHTSHNFYQQSLNSQGENSLSFLSSGVHPPFFPFSPSVDNYHGHSCLPASCQSGATLPNDTLESILDHNELHALLSGNSWPYSDMNTGEENSPEHHSLSLDMKESPKIVMGTSASTQEMFTGNHIDHDDVNDICHLDIFSRQGCIGISPVTAGVAMVTPSPSPASTSVDSPTSPSWTPCVFADQESAGFPSPFHDVPRGYTQSSPFSRGARRCYLQFSCHEETPYRPFTPYSDSFCALTMSPPRTLDPGAHLLLTCLGGMDQHDDSQSSAFQIQTQVEKFDQTFRGAVREYPNFSAPETLHNCVSLQNDKAKDKEFFHLSPQPSREARECAAAAGHSLYPPGSSFDTSDEKTSLGISVTRPVADESSADSRAMNNDSDKRRLPGFPEAFPRHTPSAR